MLPEIMERTGDPLERFALQKEGVILVSEHAANRRKSIDRVKLWQFNTVML
jgi:hypothetical protein